MKISKLTLPNGVVLENVEGTPEECARIIEGRPAPLPWSPTVFPVQPTITPFPTQPWIPGGVIITSTQEIFPSNVTAISGGITFSGMSVVHADEGSL